MVSARPTPPFTINLLRQTRLLGALLIVMVFALYVFAIGPIREFPLGDDWLYARMAQRWAETGSFQSSDYSQATVFFHALVGALAIKLFGFSFTLLRLTTLLLALVLLLSFYILLTVLEFEVVPCLLGAFSLMVIPEFVFLAFSFMTDVPALCWLTLAILCYVLAFQRDARIAWLGSLCATLAFLVRQTGLLPPLAFAAIVLTCLPRAVWLKYLVSGCLIPFLALALYIFLPGQDGFMNWGTNNVTFALTLSKLHDPQSVELYLGRAVDSLLWLGFYLMPLALVLFRPLRLRLTRPGLALLVIIGIVMIWVTVALALRNEWFPYFTSAGIRPYLSFVAGDRGAARSPIFPAWVQTLMTLLALSGGIAFVWRALALAKRGTPVHIRFILVLMLLFAFSALFFGVWYERYLLPLTLGTIMLLVGQVPSRGMRLYASAALLVGLAVFSWALVTDNFSFNDARWQAGHALLNRGTDALSVDAGYEWDGWYVYETAAAYIHDTNRPFIIEPWRYVIDPIYLLAFQPISGYEIERVIAFTTPFRQDRIFVLHRKS